MAAQLYAETQIAECLYEVLGELIEEGTIDEPLAVATLNQLSEVGSGAGAGAASSQSMRPSPVCAPPARRACTVRGTR